MGAEFFQMHDELRLSLYIGEPCEAEMDGGRVCGRPAKGLRLGNLMVFGRGRAPISRPVCGIHLRSATCYIPANYKVQP